MFKKVSTSVTSLKKRNSEKNLEKCIVSDLLISVFMGLLISWIILVTPHVVFQDLVLRGQWYSFGTLMESQYFNIFHKNNWELIEVCYDVSAEIFQKIFSSSTQKCLEILRAMEDESENIPYLLFFSR